MVGLLFVLTMFAAGTSVYAGPIYSFHAITSNSPVDGAIGATQVFMEVLPDLNPAKVQFRFFNTGPLVCSLTGVYFDDGSLLDLAQIINGPGVLFSQPATPAELPGAHGVVPPFVTTDSFSTSSDNPSQHNGVNPGEELSIVFDLQLGQTYVNVLDNLTSADLRVGIHIQAFPDGLSEAFINDPTVPAPGAGLLCLLGAALVERLRRRRMLEN